ncbi:MAG: S8 family serine peptidase [Armatimonadetes bacterium]|nr:S8 family serine peptidase [Armatimonadota bacterium]
MNPLFVAFMVLNSNGALDVRVERTGLLNTLTLGGVAFHQTKADVKSLNLVGVPGSLARIILWDEVAGRKTEHFSAVSLKGSSVARVTETSDQIKLRFGDFDPLVKVLPVDPKLRAPEGNEMFIVQFSSQPLQEFRDAINAAGGRVQNYLPDNAYIVRMGDATVSKVKSLPYVRWVGALEPGWRVDEQVQTGLHNGSLGDRDYNIQVSGDDAEQKASTTQALRDIGATILASPRDGQVIEARMSPDVVQRAAALNGLLFIDLKGKPEADMDNVRPISGASYLQSVAGYTGQGINAHVIDGGFRQTHQDFVGHVTVRANSTDTSHGSSTTGIVFGNGTANVLGKGMLPSAQGVFSVYTVNWTGAARLALTQDTVNVYNCVVESNSWGDSLTGSYTTISSYMDEICLKTDLLICNSMSNWGNNTQVRPQAWAKNIVSIGGVYHFNDQNSANDAWQNGASIGPAADGRMKPELCYFYDSIFCPTNTSDTAYTTGFNGTSAATPISTGCFGLLYQMWGNGVFGNTTPGSTMFANRCHASTAKAIMVNQAYLYPNTQTDIERKVQGWGRPNVQNIYDARKNMFVVDESDVLQNLQSKAYQLYVAPGTPAFKATMSYTDYWASAGANPTRVNTVTLKVTDPSGVVYYGNNGMLATTDASNITAAGGAADPRNNLQNVFVNNPAAGTWTVEVSADSVVMDTHFETPEVDQDFGLCVSGVVNSLEADSLAPWKIGAIKSGGLAEAARSDNQFVLAKTPILSHFGEITETGIICTYHMPSGSATPNSLKVRAESSTNVNGLPERIYLWNWANNAWEVLYNNTGTTAESVVDAVATGDISRFVDGSGTIKAGLTYERNTSLPTVQPWESKIDHLRVLLQ